MQEYEIIRGVVALTLIVSVLGRIGWDIGGFLTGLFK